LAADGSERENNRMSIQMDGDLPLNSRSVSRKRLLTLEPRAKAATGKNAVEASKEAKQLQDSTFADSDDDEVIKTGTVKKIGAKTFYLENNVWIDSEFKEEAKLSEIKITFASDVFFSLINKETALAQFFALGEQVVVVWKGKVYRIIK
jgi:hypothetical protein